MDQTKALLPAGLRDVLPPEAEAEQEALDRIAAVFGANGYEPVRPPLVEFEETLFDGAGAATAPQAFRVMDPLSGRMMAVRADLTPQIARIAASRLTLAPRPLRLSYAGAVLRVRGAQLRQERQLTQAGLELVGSTAAAADAEIILVLAQALDALNLSDYSFDLTLPRLPGLLMDGLDLDEEERSDLAVALGQKDPAAVAAFGATATRLFTPLMQATGPADQALGALQAAADLPEPARREIAGLSAVLGAVRAEAPDLALTIDVLEARGFEYHHGVAFALFAKGIRGELGRGGRYLVGSGEPATGATLLVDRLRDVLPRPHRRRLLVPAGVVRARLMALQGDGWTTVALLDPETDLEHAARARACGHLLRGDDIVTVPDTGTEGVTGK